MCYVVPYVGTWIEMHRKVQSAMRLYVVPYVGTWIEIIVKPVIKQGA